MSQLRPSIARRLAIALLVLCALPATGSAAAGPIRGDASRKCLDVLQGSRGDGVPIIAWTCNGTLSQRWELTTAGELRTLGDTKCLDVLAGGRGVGTPLVSYRCTGGANQRWRIGADRTIIGVQSGLCIPNTEPTGWLALARCGSGSSLKWSVTPVVQDSAPPTVPGVPVMTQLTCRTGTLSWTASTDAVGVAFYDVYHDGQLLRTVEGGTLSTSVALTPGASWGFYVNARDAAGNVSQGSPTLRVTVPQCAPDTQAPSVPTGLAAAVTGTAVTLRWNAATDDNGVRTYDVLRDGAPVGSTANLTFTDSGLAPSSTHRYAVVARDAQDNASAPSAPITVTAGAACASAVCGARQVATDTDLPWGVVPLPDGTAIYSRRDSHDLVRLDLTTGAKTELGTVPNVQSTDGEGGLLGLAATPGFPTTDPWLYIQHTSPTDNRIVRIKLIGNTLDTASEQVLLSGIPRNKFHNGGRLRFGPDGKLYATTGDAQNGAYAQDRANLAGKVLRIDPDGTIPSDNPFGNAVWSLGHRNPQGLAFDGQGRLWEQEFGNSAQDETNLIQKGGNYGWPDCEGTISQGGSGCATAGYLAPKRVYPVADGSCSGVAIVRDALFVACQRGQRLYRHVISGASLTGTTELFSGTYGRLRTVEPTFDGGLLLTTTNTKGNEQIVRVALG